MIRVEVSSPPVTVVVPTAIATRILMATAGEFLRTAELAAPALAAASGRRLPGPSIPVAVCTALAAELFLKSALVSLRCRTADQLPTHDLTALVELLPPQHQASLRSATGVDAASFAMHLKHIGDAFKAWRPLHENPTPLLDGGFFTRFTAAAQALAAQALQRR